MLLRQDHGAGPGRRGERVMTDDEIGDRLKLALSIGDIGRADILRELRETRAALDQARALLPFAVVECVQTHTYSRFGTKNRCEFCECSGVLHSLAIALGSGSGGAT